MCLLECTENEYNILCRGLTSVNLPGITVLNVLIEFSFHFFDLDRTVMI